MAEKMIFRVLINTQEIETIAQRSQGELNAKASEVTRTLLRMWMAGSIEITAEDMVQYRGRDASLTNKNMAHDHDTDSPILG